ncbi:MAG: dinuclear metal center YbgI/SA1388 family protein [Halovenus sp.]|jgi:dinuclear metal center YbgI/SA1388 family protein
MDCQTICDRLDDELDVPAYAGVDPSPNGLQVGPATRTVDHVAVAVDAAVETAERAAAADMLVTHHGIIWGGIERVTGLHHRRIRALVDADLPLYVAHLPLDGHQTLGNAARIADLLKLVDREPFGTDGGLPVGQRGRLPEPVSVDALCDRLRPHLDTGGQGIRTLAHGPDEAQEIAIVTGSGADFLGEAAAADVDLFLTGEGKQKLYHEAKEQGVNVVLGGHYATETFGVRAIADLLADWGLDTTFLDCPTGL